MSQLYTETFGQGAPVVMLHGWAMHSGVWRHFAQEIAQNNQVTCVDLPGHGRSAGCSLIELDSWITAALEVFPDKPCHIVAWSLGGNVALELANKYPEKVKSLTLLASNPHFLSEAEWSGVSELVLDEFTSKLARNIDATLFRFLTLQVQGMENTKQYVKGIEMALQECAAPEIHMLVNGLALLKTTDSRNALQALSCPVQLILGSVDSLVPADILEDCQSLQPKLSCHLIEGAGHIPFITHKKETLELVQNFLEQKGVKQ